jgi:pantoate--beta-alanine ligase
MITVTSILKLRSLLTSYRQEGKTIGLVPTMGFLHEGHMSLVDEARRVSSVVVMSIFVNPLQFAAGEDLETYPRDLLRDEMMARDRGVNILFIPDVTEMYPSQIKTTIYVSKVTSQLCGASRPGHFDGVATVVSKLFHIVQPDTAFFGQKDAQQVAVIQQMVDDLNIPVKIVPCPIVREADGLAMSSRNVYLSEEERKQAVILSQSLYNAQQGIKDGQSPQQIRERLIMEISSQSLANIDYVEILSYPALEIIEQFSSNRWIIAVAVRFGKTRLIDNVIGGGEEKTYVSHHDESQNTPSYSY